MRAVVHDRYGPPDVLRLAEVEKPVPKEDEILDPDPRHDRQPVGLRLARCAPVLLSRSSPASCGRSGRSSAASSPAWSRRSGSAVTTFEAGDEVFGIKVRAHTPSTSARGRARRWRTSRPAMSFEEAAAVCDGGIIALTCLRKAGLRQGQSIVVYGASGSIGTAAVQLAKHFGAHVTAVCNTKNVELVRSLGADEVVDYTAGGLHEERRDVRRRLRRGRQAPRSGAAGARSEARRRLRRDRPRLSLVTHLLVMLARGGSASGACDSGPEVHAEGGRLPQGADRGRGVPGRDRPLVPARGRRRGDAVRRDAAEDGQRRPDGRPSVR